MARVMKDFKDLLSAKLMQVGRGDESAAIRNFTDLDEILDFYLDTLRGNGVAPVRTSEANKHSSDMS